MDMNTTNSERRLRLGAVETAFTLVAPECLGETTATPTLMSYINGLILLSGQSYGICTVYNRSNATNIQELALFGRTHSYTHGRMTAYLSNKTGSDSIMQLQQNGSYVTWHRT